jgi:beta-catenin-like protein 1
LSGEEGGRSRCIRFVDASGLKSLFPLFMGKGNKKLKKSHHSAFNEPEDEGNPILAYLMNLYLIVLV